MCGTRLGEGESPPALIVPETTDSAARSAFRRHSARASAIVAAVFLLRRGLHSAWRRIPLLDMAGMPRLLNFPFGEVSALRLLITSTAQSAGFVLGVVPGDPVPLILAAVLLLAMIGLLLAGGLIIRNGMSPFRQLTCYVLLRDEDAYDERMLFTERIRVMVALQQHRPKAMWLSAPRQPLVLRVNPRNSKSGPTGATPAGGGYGLDPLSRSSIGQEQEGLGLGLSMDGFVLRYGVLFENLRGHPVAREQAHGECVRHTRNTNLLRLSKRPSQRSATSSTLCPPQYPPWGVYYNLVKWTVTMIAAVLLGITSVPCACETGDGQHHWECTWPQSLALSWLFASQLGIIVAFQPMHNRVEQLTETLMCASNLAIVSIVQLSWHSDTIRKVMIEHASMLFYLQLGSFCVQVLSIWYKLWVQAKICTAQATTYASEIIQFCRVGIFAPIGRDD
ncbi:hypothetical protein CYMTET_51972 [Cymbomonas tetramitiformis]|uniref:Uncharacterized protein n=1 Tax=Cymbomonas tetramitiformis TaxID=36881 RepID=A0AAE0ERT5_9CHLO|nr:hypothetical protein CYMTET_51972 [Cymbomonas tetramitiformis]